MAKQFSKNPDFKASKGWFERFVKRNQSLKLASYFGMKMQSICNEEKLEKGEMDI